MELQMIEHEDELEDRTIQNIILNPQEGDKIVAKKWIGDKTFVNGLIYLNEEWHYLPENGGHKWHPHIDLNGYTGDIGTRYDEEWQILE